MATTRNLVHYLPHFMQVYSEMQKIMDAEQSEIDAVWDNILKIWDNQFLTDCTVEGVARWEKMMGIYPKATDTLDERKFRIASKWSREFPYTITKLREILTNLCGTDGFSITLSANSYVITIMLALTSANNFADVENITKTMIPANMIITVQIMYNRHNALSTMTHNGLSVYTHSELKSEVFE